VQSAAALSPTARGIPDVAERVKRLEAYENWHVPTKMDFEAVVDNDTWSQHWQNWERMQSLMRESQELATKINLRVASAYKAL
jgi:hypothetical protein